MKKILFLAVFTAYMLSNLRGMESSIIGASPSPAGHAVENDAEKKEVTNLSNKLSEQGKMIADLIKKNKELTALINKAVDSSPKGKEKKEKGESTSLIKESVLKVISEMVATATFYGIWVGFAALVSYGWINIAWAKPLLLQIGSFAVGIFGSAAKDVAGVAIDTGKVGLDIAKNVTISGASTVITAAGSAFGDAASLVNEFIPVAASNAICPVLNKTAGMALNFLSGPWNSTLSMIGNHTQGVALITGGSAARLLKSPRFRHALMTVGGIILSVATLGAV